MAKTISTEPTKTNIGKVTQVLADSPIQLESLSAGLTREQLCQPLAPGERSFAEALAHLIHSEARSSEAIYLALLLGLWVNNRS